MSPYWLIVIVPCVASLAFFGGAVFAASFSYDKAYDAGFAAGHRSYRENGPY